MTISKKEETVILYCRGLKVSNKSYLDKICSETNRKMGEVINYIISQQRKKDAKSSKKSS